MTEKTITAAVPAHPGSHTITHANGKTPTPVICFNPTCSRPGTHFPVILFGPKNRVPGKKLPYRLEVPKAVCLECQRHFNPEVFISDSARGNIEAFLAKNGEKLPDYSRLYVTWRSLAGPDWPEVKAAGEARLWIDG